MTCVNPFYRRTPNTVSHYVLTYEWTDDHITEEQARPLRYTCDDLADRAIERLEAIVASLETSTGDAVRRRSPRSGTPAAPDGSVPAVVTEASHPPPAKRDLFALLRDNHTSDPVLSELWQSASNAPEWVSWPQIQRGQNVFYRYCGPMLTGLAYHALLGGMGAARVADTLSLTGGFSPRHARKRIFETTQFVLQVTRTLAGIQPGGEGWESTLRVRLLHAQVRRRILRLAKSRPGYYDVEKSGVPISDLDAAGTIAVFGPALIWMALPRQGIFLRRQEEEDYVALWRYVAHVIGAPTDMFATRAKALAVLQSMYTLEIHPSETSKVLAGNVIQCLADSPPAYPSAQFLTASARWLIGSELGDDLGLKRQGWWYSLLMLAQCAFLSAHCYAHRSFPAWDARVQRVMREMCWKVVVEGQAGLQGTLTTFGFQYVPELGVKTLPAESSMEKTKLRSNERRNLIFLGLLTTLVVAGTWTTFKITSRVAGYFFG